MRSKTSYDKGLFAEFIARMYLRFHGYKIIKSRYITGRNTNRAEIDIIATKNEVIHFIEVKTRKTDICGEPLEAITTKKYKKRTL